MICAICNKEKEDYAILNDTILERAKKYKLIKTNKKYTGNTKVVCCKNCFMVM